MSDSGWIGVDLDGTLAEYGKWEGADHIGKPIPAMVERVKLWLKQGAKVKIFTARVHGHGVPVFTKSGTEIQDMISPIKKWCKEHIGQELEVTNVKDFSMLQLWDDRAVQVEMNTGKVIGDE